MSVTFFLAAMETCYPPCPDCGGTMDGLNPADRNCANMDCGGYGLDPVENLPSMNISNSNARSFLFDALGYDPADFPYLGGEMDPDDALRRLATVNPSSVTHEPVVLAPGKVICGLTSRQVESYVRRLTQIAKIAKKNREPIIVG